MSFFLSSSSTWLVRLHRAGRLSPICLSCLFPLLIYIILYIDLRDPRLARCRHRKLMNSAGWLFCSLNNISNSIAGGRIHVGNQFDYRLLPCLLFWLRRFLHRPLILLDVFAAPKQELAGDFRFMFLSLSHRRSIRHTQQQQQRATSLLIIKTDWLEANRPHARAWVSIKAMLKMCFLLLLLLVTWRVLLSIIFPRNES